MYGDTNSTLAGALAAAQAQLPLAHVEAGMRSFDRAMPEELNRVLTDHASDLLFCSTETAVENLKRESVAGAIHLVGDVMADVSLAFAPIAADRSRVLEELAVAQGDYLLVTAHRAGNVDLPERLEALVALIEALPGKVVLPLHPRTAKRLDEAGLRGRLEQAAILTPPLGYLDFLELARNARAVLTDSGGVQKEAYLLETPCVTLRDTTEWVETVDAGWNVLVDLDADAALGALARPAPTGERPSLYGGGKSAGAHPRRTRFVHSPAMNIGVIGLGYVGLPLVVEFLEAGHEVVGVDVDQRRVQAIGEGISDIEDIPSERLQAVLERLTATTRYADLAHVETAIIAVPTPLTRNREPDLGPLVSAGQLARGGPPTRAARGPRVDHVPRHDARAARAAARGVGARRRASTSTWPSRPSASTQVAPTTRFATRQRSWAA